MPLVELRPGLPGPALFVLHDMQGTCQHLLPVIERLPPLEPVYGIEAAGHDRIEDMARHYIAEILAQQPAGPYHLLGGLDMGSLLAAEMAHQLNLGGHDVGLVVLLDAACPRLSPHFTPRLPWFVNVFDPWRWRLERFCLELRRAGILQTLVSSLTARHDLSPSPHQEACRRYRPRYYRGAALYLHAAQPSRAVDAFRIGWEDLFTDGCELQLVSGRHATLLQPPHLDVVAEKLSAALARARRSPTAALLGIEASPAASWPAAFELQARRFPQRPALVDDRSVLSYEQLVELSHRLASSLSARLQRQQRVAVLMGHQASAVVAILAILRAGLVYAPLDEAAPHQRNVAILQHLEAAVLLTDAAHYAQAVALASGALPVLQLDSELQHGSRVPLPALAADDLACIVFTSGSTGRPKGVMRTHGALLQIARSYRAVLDLGAGDRVAHTFPFHAGAGLSNLIRTLSVGAALYLRDLKRQGLTGFPAWLRRQSISVLFTLPSLVRHLVSSMEPDETLPHLRAINLAAEPLFASDVAALRRRLDDRCIVINMLAMTETNAVAYHVVAMRSIEQRIPVGLAVPGTTLRVLDENDHEVAPGEVGNLVVESEFVSSGYWRDEAATRAAFSSEPRRYRSADLVRRLADQRLVYVGRADARVKIRGFGVDVSEVQGALLQLDYVRDAVVVARESAGAGQSLAAYLEVSDRAFADAARVRAALATTLSDYMLPSTLVFLDALPRTSTGKVDLVALTAPAAAAPARSQRVPRTATESWLAGLWQEVLGHVVGIDEDFFEVGGDSLKAATVLERIERQRGRNLGVAAMLTAPTIEALATWLDAATAVPCAASLVPIRPRAASGTTLFCLHVAMGDVLYAERLSHYLPADVAMYGLQTPAVDADVPMLTSVEAMAASYLQEMRAVQARGPYYLFGHSFGCVLAFEVAQQLQARGETVALLGMSDMACPTPSPLATDRVALFADRLDPLASLTERAFKMFWLHDYGPLRRTSAEEWQRLKRHWRRKVWRDATELRQFRLTRRNFAAARKYRPQRYAGRITFFLAAEEHYSRRDHRLDWCEFAVQSFEIHLVPGSHSHVSREPHVRVLAEKLYACIERGRRASSVAVPE